jgi:hypothetical protein
LAASPTNLSSSLNPTTDGVILDPYSFGMISTTPFLNIPTQEYVVPKSIPITGHLISLVSYKVNVLKNMVKTSVEIFINLIRGGDFIGTNTCHSLINLFKNFM